MTSHIKFKIKKIVYPQSPIEEITGKFSVVGCDLIIQTAGAPVELNKFGNLSVVFRVTPPISFSKEYEADVKEETNKYGKSYLVTKLYDKKVSSFTQEDKDKFLLSCLTEKQYNALKSVYEDPFVLLQKRDYESLAKCKGVGEATAKRLCEKYDKQINYAEFIIELQDYNLTQSTMQRLLNTYGSAHTAIQKIKENVYILADEVDGIGFLKADALALKAGMKPNSTERLDAYIKFFLYSQAQNGLSWCEPRAVFENVQSVFHTTFSQQLIGEAFHRLQDKSILNWTEDKSKIYLNYFYNLEQNIATEFERINTAKTFSIPEQIMQQSFDMFKQEIGYDLTEEQKTAVNNILNNNVSLLVGGAGTGKSSTIKVLVTALKLMGFQTACATLSGKASARIQEATGFEGKTIHRLLKYKPEQGFMHNEHNLLWYDMIIIDESSFVGGELFLALLKAIRNGSKLLLVGDSGQLPSIGVSNVFFDVIKSHKYSVNILNTIHRQAMKSGIITTSKLIREHKQITPLGWTGVKTLGELQDFTIDLYDDRCLGLPKLKRWYASFCKDLKDCEYTQVVLPMKNKGEVNVYEVNRMIQQKYNPHEEGKPEYSYTRNNLPITIRLNDRVINKQNSYEAPLAFPNETQKTEQVFNGFCGRVIDIKPNYYIIKFDLIDEPIKYDNNTIHNVELGYAITAASSQGSEYKNAIVVIDFSSYIMNCSELVYTAITRAKEKCVLMAESNALREAIRTSHTIHKQTFLTEMLIK